METLDDIDLSDIGTVGVWPLAWVHDEICRRAANASAAEGEQLLLIAEFDRRLGWKGSGCQSCAAWLSWQTSLDLRTAHEKVRVAHALVAYPRLASAMADGSLSYAKARSISRIADEYTLDSLLDFAVVSTSNQVERLVAAFRRREAAAEDAEAWAHRERSFSYRVDGASMVFTLRVPAETGAVILTCVDQFLLQDGDTTDGLRARRADAAYDMACSAMCVQQHDGKAKIDDAYLVTLHVSADIFDDLADERVDGQPVASDRPGGSQLVGQCCVAPGDGLGADPISVPSTSARRILCDAVLEGFRRNADGSHTLGQGRRTVSRPMKRALRLRDGGCRFPGCTHSIWVDAHHIRHWLDHGRTIEVNLVCLCRHHHRLVHEAGWTVTGNPNGELWFHTPGGTILAGQPVRTAGDPSGDDVHSTATDAGELRLHHPRFEPDQLARRIRNEAGTRRDRAAAEANRHNN